jgi:hypothetical protein
MDKSERVERQESLHTADGPRDYLWLATVISTEKCIVILFPQPLKS